MKILGVSAFYHDSAACLVEGGRIVAAAQEERFTRRKNDSSFPAHAVRYCLREGGLDDVRGVDCVAFYESPALRFERILATFADAAPRGFEAFARVAPLWAGEKLWMGDFIRRELGYDGTVRFYEHHLSHAASAFFPSPFSEAAVLTLDGVGEWSTGSFGVGRGSHVELSRELRYPHSLGLLYSAFTHHLGFEVNSGEYKVMGLAPYGEPRYADTILSRLVDLRADGSFTLETSAFDYTTGLAMTGPAFAGVVGMPRREPDAPLEQRHMDLARSIQEVTNEIVLRMARHVRSETGLDSLCLAGGVALNCVANSRVLEERIFDRVWVQPAAGDAGGALGAALLAWHHEHGGERAPDGPGDSMQGALLGPSFSDEEIRYFLESHRIPHEALDRDELVAETAELLDRGAVVGWFQGRMEFGPRALGARSILGDARSAEMQSTLNLKIKFRESFRPFAPAVLEERASEWFAVDRPSPYMLFTAQVARDRTIPTTPEEDALFGIDKLKVRRSEIPAVTHVDGSARLQTVARDVNPLFHDLLLAFADRTGCPVVINTSFNVRDEPIVCTPEDAFRCFMRTGMDYLVLGPFLLDKREQVAASVAAPHAAVEAGR